MNINGSKDLYLYRVLSIIKFELYFRKRRLSSYNKEKLEEINKFMIQSKPEPMIFQKLVELNIINFVSILCFIQQYKYNMLYCYLFWMKCTFS